MKTIISDSLLTNFSKEQRHLYEKAINEYKNNGGTLGVHIIEDAFWGNGFLDNEMNSLHTIDTGKDHSAFWRVYDKLKSEQGETK